MTTQINAYLNFNGNAREAMEFYQQCIGGELNIQTIGESPMRDQCPSAMHGQVLHATFTKDSMILMASDMIGPDGYVKGNNMALSVSCSSEEEINTFFTKLSEGGKVLDALKVQFWGAIFGVTDDKFGIRWMFNYDKNLQK